MGLLGRVSSDAVAPLALPVAPHSHSHVQARIHSHVEPGLRLHSHSHLHSRSASASHSVAALEWSAGIDWQPAKGRSKAGGAVSEGRAIGALLTPLSVLLVLALAGDGPSEEARVWGGCCHVGDGSGAVL